MDSWIVNISVTAIIGIIAYFLKRTMNTVDKQGAELQQHAIELKGIAVSVEKCEEDVEALDNEVELIKENYTPKKVHTKDFDECKEEIKSIKADYIMKEDFYRELNKVDRKLDYITNILMEVYKGKGEK